MSSSAEALREKRTPSPAQPPDPLSTPDPAPRDDDVEAVAAPASSSMEEGDELGELPPLHTPHRRRLIYCWIGITVLNLDLCYMPITYYYALHFGTSLKMQDSTPRPTLLADRC